MWLGSSCLQALSLGPAPTATGTSLGTAMLPTGLCGHQVWLPRGQGHAVLTLPEQTRPASGAPSRDTRTPWPLGHVTARGRLLAAATWLSGIVPSHLASGAWGGLLGQPCPGGPALRELPRVLAVSSPRPSAAPAGRYRALLRSWRGSFGNQRSQPVTAVSPGQGRARPSGRRWPSGHGVGSSLLLGGLWRWGSCHPAFTL